MTAAGKCRRSPKSRPLTGCWPLIRRAGGALCWVSLGHADRQTECDAPDTDAHEELLRRFAARLPQDAVKVTVCHTSTCAATWTCSASGHRAYLLEPRDGRSGGPGPGHAGPADDPSLSALPRPGAPGPARPGPRGRCPAAAVPLFLHRGPGGEFYPRQTRNWIIDDLAADPRGLITGREGWYYHQAVYDGQIRGDGRNVNAFLDLDQKSSSAWRWTRAPSRCAPPAPAPIPSACGRRSAPAPFR